MSPRAACRLESLGFENIYDYVGGIADWQAAGLPTEGTGSDIPRIGDATTGDPPTCRLTERVGEVLSRVHAAGWDECVVTITTGIVLGRLRGESWENDPETVVEEAMEAGPSTVRPHKPLEPLVKRMRERSVRRVLVTSPEGKLIGILREEDAEQLLTDPGVVEVWQECEGCPGQWKIIHKRAA